MLNIIIGGIPEKSDENVKMTVDDMLSDMATNFRSDELSAAYRLGSNTGGRTRPIIPTGRKTSTQTQTTYHSQICLQCPKGELFQEHQQASE